MDAAVTGVNADGRRRRWADHREQRREELIDAAVAAIRRHGAEVNMEAIATAAGVSKPVLYRYFADKAQLWTAVRRRAAEQLVSALRPAVAGACEERAVVAAAIDVYLGLIEADPCLYLFVTHPPGGQGGGDPAAESAQAVANVLARAIGDRLRALGLDAGPAQPWAHGLVGCVRAVGDWWVCQGRPIGREALTDYLTTLLWSGIAGVQAAADLPGGLRTVGR